MKSRDPWSRIKPPRKLQILNFFSCKKVINNQQFGFRKGYSTELAITDLHNRIIKNTDNGYYTCCIFLDLSKAFDTVNHSILLEKLYAYGIRGNMHSLLKSYLSNRKQFTWCNNTKSENSTIVCGVPQGSTLGPLFFSLYVNDLPTHTNFNVNLQGPPPKCRLLKIHLFQKVKGKMKQTFKNMKEKSLIFKMNSYLLDIPSFCADYATETFRNLRTSGTHSLKVNFVP